MRTVGNPFKMWVILILLASFVRAESTQDSDLVLSAPLRTNEQFQFTLAGEHGTTYVLERSDDLMSWTPLLTNSDYPSIRLLTTSMSNSAAFYRARRDLEPVFRGALLVRSNINLQGNFIKIDSFDSSDTNFSTAGAYDFSKRKAGGNIASGYGFIAVGNADINGKLYVASSNAVGIDLDGSVGDLAWADPGIQPGWCINDYRICSVPDVVAPYGGIVPTGSGTNKYVLGSGSYILSGDLILNTGNTMLVTGNAILYVASNLLMSASSEINVAPGATLQLYVAGPSASLGNIHTSGTALNFQYYGLPGNTSITWNGRTNCIGVIYAPAATLTLSGGGSAPTSLSGAFVLNSCTVNGTFSIHFDEALMASGPKH